MSQNLLKHWVMHCQRKSFYKVKKIKSAQNLKKCLELDDGRCRVCGSFEQVAPHHILYRSLGGDDSLHNLITLCFYHHRAEHDGKFNVKDFLIRLSESHPVPTWFRWEKSIEELKKR